MTNHDRHAAEVEFSRWLARQDAALRRACRAEQLHAYASAMLAGERP